MLITLAIIGVVAALTIPALAKNINKKVKEHQISVITKRFDEGLRLYSTQDSAFNGQTYADTEDFLNGLSKHFKMVKICGSDNIQNCMPYTQIKYKKSDTEDGAVDVSSLSTPEKLGLKSSEFYRPAAFITAAGTPYIVLLRKDCIIDPDSNDQSPMGCIDGIYDYNGSRLKNKFEDDVKSLGNAKVGDVECIAQVGKLCIMSKVIRASYQNFYPLLPAGYKASTIEGYPYFTDVWKMGEDYCEQVVGGKFPTNAQLAQIATALYGQTIGATENKRNLDWTGHEDIITSLGLPEDILTCSNCGFRVFSLTSNSRSAYRRHFSRDSTDIEIRGNANRVGSEEYTFCVKTMK